MVLPVGLLGKFDVGEGEIVKGKDYLLYIKKGTYNEIKQRLIKEYAEYAEEKRKKVCIFKRPNIHLLRARCKKAFILTSLLFTAYLT